MEQITDDDTDIIFLTETWLKNDKNDVTATIKSLGYKLLHNRRKDRDKEQGGGVGIMFKKTLSCKQVRTTQYISFEHTVVNIKTTDGQMITLISIYRLLFIPTKTFFTEFRSLLEILCSSKEMFIIAGDVNIHMDNPQNVYTKQFKQILLSFDVTQHVNSPTHIHGHILDVVITRSSKPEIVEISSNNIALSDHFLLKFTLKLDIPSNTDYKTITYRNLKRIDNHRFCMDINEAYRNINSTIFSEKVSNFHAKTKEILDSHAPIRTKMIKIVRSAPWFDEEYRNLRIQRRRAEKLFRATQSDVHKNNLTNLRKATTALARDKKKAYFSTKIEECNGDIKSLHSCLNMLIDNKKVSILPEHDSSKDLAERFNNFFKDKIKNIRQSFKPYPPSDRPSGSLNYNLRQFEPTNRDEIKTIILEKGINCSPEDTIPIKLLRNNLETFIPIWTDLVNLSISEGSMECLKDAVLIPLIKEMDEVINADLLKNYRPVSNLLFVSKLIERVVAIRLESYMKENNLQSNEQYGYKKNHSTEMLMVKVVNDLLMVCDENSATLLMLLDLSAAFDTVDHQKLIKILQFEIGITGTALKWFRSYLCGRTLKVKIGDNYSPSEILLFGVPQGSVLGPILFNIYIRSFYGVIKTLSVNVVGYADDHQLSIPFIPLFQVSTIFDKVNKCFQIIDRWMNEYFLRLNADKTKFLVICSATVRKKIVLRGTFINDKCIRFVSNARNLGVIVDEELNFDDQINKITSSCFQTIYKISRIKYFLRPVHLKTLVVSLILSKLDYCNAVYYGMSSKNLKKMQSVQNAAARLVSKTNRFDNVSISKFIREYHWLRVRDRISFKVLLITHKALSNSAPSDIMNLIKRSRNSRVDILQHAQSHSKFGDRCFQVAAPKLWNSLPPIIRCERDITTFKRKLKTFLFDHGDDYHQRLKTI